MFQIWNGNFLSLFFFLFFLFYFSWWKLKEVILYCFCFSSYFYTICQSQLSTVEDEQNKMMRTQENFDFSKLYIKQKRIRVAHTYKKHIYIYSIKGWGNLLLKKNLFSTNVFILFDFPVKSKIFKINFL